MVAERYTDVAVGTVIVKPWIALSTCICIAACMTVRQTVCANAVELVLEVSIHAGGAICFIRTGIAMG